MEMWLTIVLQPIISSLAMAAIPEALILPDNLDAFCPDVDVCRKTQGVKPRASNISEDVACCTACSCDASCTETGTCCFPALNPDEECLYPATDTHNPLGVRPYRMVVKDLISDPEGELSQTFDEKNDTKKSCGEKVYSPYGSVRPVYSKRNATIYKNPACAESHKVNDGISWLPKIVCPSSSGPQASASVQALEYGVIPQLCHVEFVYPGKQSDLQSHACYRDLIQTCPENNFTVPGRFGIFADEVRSLCQSGFISPGRVLSKNYANVFCVICNGWFGSLTRTKRCTQFDPQTKDSDEGKSFEILLKLDVLNKIPTRNQVDPIACDDGIWKRDNQTSRVCRDVKCPQHQFRGANGNCEYMGQGTGDRNTYIMMLKLSIGGLVAYTKKDFREIIQDLLSQWENISPWHEQRHIFYEYDLDRPNNSTIETLYVEIILPPNRGGKFQTLVKSVEDKLKMRWTLTVANSVVSLHQGFAEFSGIADIGVGNLRYSAVEPSWYRVIDHDSWKALNMSKKQLLIVKQGEHSEVPKKVHLTKLYLCQQVELQQHEFVLYAEHIDAPVAVVSPMALYNKLTNKLLLENEFWLLERPNGDQLARLCLEDSGFSTKATKSNGGIKNKSMVVMVIACWLCVQYMTNA